MKKHLLILLSIVSIQSITAQDTAIAQPPWYQQAQQQLYGFGQKGWEKTKEGIAWIKAHPKKAAALGLGGLGVAVLAYEATKRRMRERVEAKPYIPQWAPKIPNYVVEARKIREQLRADIQKIKRPIMQRIAGSGIIAGSYPPLLFKYVYEGIPLSNIYMKSQDFGYGGDPHFFRNINKLPKDLKYYNWPKFTGEKGLLLRDPLNQSIITTDQGHSLIGVALISPKQEGKEERIQELSKRGVRLTDNDKKLLELYNWEKNIPVREAMYEALLADPEMRRAPKDVRKLIYGELEDPLIIQEPEEEEVFVDKFIVERVS